MNFAVSFSELCTCCAGTRAVKPICHSRQIIVWPYFGLCGVMDREHESNVYISSWDFNQVAWNDEHVRLKTSAEWKCLVHHGSFVDLLQHLERADLIKIAGLLLRFVSLLLVPHRTDCFEDTNGAFGVIKQLLLAFLVLCQTSDNQLWEKQLMDGTWW